MKLRVRKIQDFIVQKWHFIAIFFVVLVSSFVFFQDTPAKPPKVKPSKSPEFVFEAKNKNYTAQIGASKSPRPFLSFSSKTGSNVSFQMDANTDTSVEEKDNKITFQNVNNNFDVVYTPLANGVKEEIIINNQTDSSEYFFDVVTVNATPRKTLENTYSRFFYSDAGIYQFHLEKPFAVDARGVRTDDVTMQVRQSKNELNKYQILVRVKPEWLKSKERSYPITIDPTIITDTSAEFVLGTLNRLKDIPTNTYSAVAAGGTITFADGYAIHTFTSDGTFIPNGITTVDYLVIGGGGGGGGSNWGGGGGGGAGGYRTSNGLSISGNQTVTIGSGGNGGSTAPTNGTNGGSTVFGSITSLGGGGGGRSCNGCVSPGLAGSSGGGGGYLNGGAGTGTGGQGTNGAADPSNNGGGGGGSTSAGSGINGGNGTISNITGTNITYAGGGGGSAGASGVGGTSYGGGGKGGYTSSGYGGQPGVVIVRYPAVISGTSPNLETYYQELVADQYTVGLWHFNEASGNALDSSGNNNTGTPTGTTINTTTHRLGSAARTFNGTTDFINAGNNSIYPKGDLTIESWFVTSSVTDVGIVTHGTTSDWLYWFGTLSNKLTCKLYQSTSGSAYSQATSNINVNDGVWHHGACVVSGSTVSVYVDGILTGTSSTATGSRDVSTAGNLYIGKFDWTSTYNFSGSIDEVRISNIARSSEEIKGSASRRPYGIFTSDVLSFDSPVFEWSDMLWSELGVNTGDGEIAKDSTSLVAQWNFNETSGTTAVNEVTDNTSPITGGSVTDAGGYRIHTFNSSGNLIVNSPVTVDYLIVGGGGGGGYGSGAGGGGAGGGFLTGNSISLTAGSYPVTVGTGGNGGVSPTNGQDSVFNGITANGGGTGGSNSFGAGVTGGSGGGGGNRGLGTVGSPGQGNSGGNGNDSPYYAGGGGGGAGANGGSASGTSAGNGGVGLSSSITGSSVFYAGGGGGGRDFYAGRSPNGGSGGNGGGGASGTSGAVGTNGTANTGGGGGGGSQSSTPGAFAGGSGGSGVVVVRYPYTSSSCGASCNGTLTNFASTASQDQAAGTGWTANNRRWGSGSLMFDGTNDNVTIGSESNFDFERTNSFSLSSWIKTSYTGNYQGIFYKMASGAPYTGYGLLVNQTTGTLRFQLVNTANTNHMAIDSNQSITDGSWHHVVATYDGSGGAAGAKIYIDGKLAPVTVSINNLSASILNNVSLTIGSRNNTDVFFNGAIDSSAVFSRALTASEILSNYQSGNIEIQTRVGTSSNPNDGTWEDWKPINSETTIDNLDNPLDYATPSATIFSGTLVSTSSSTFPKIEGNASLLIQTGTISKLNNVVSLWHLDETSGTGAYIKDISGANNGTPTGTSTVNGIAKKARNFNGSSDYINAGDSPVWDFGAGNFTIEAWVKRSTTGTNDVIVGKDNNTAGTRQFHMQITSANVVRIAYNTAADAIVYLDSTATITDNKWHYIVGQRAGNAFNIYIDGVLVSTGTTAGTHGTMQATTTSLRIGQRQYTGAEDYFAGTIDEVKISNLAISADEVSESFRMGRDHYINKIISSTDLSDKKTIPFYIAADKPGTYLSATIGESAFANYQPDTNTIGLWHLDEKDRAGTHIKESSSGVYGGAASGTVVTPGKIGSSRNFNAISNYLSIGNYAPINNISDFTVDTWLYPTAQTAATHFRVFSKQFSLYVGQYGNQVSFYMGNGTAWVVSDVTGGTLTPNQWNHVAWVKSGTSYYVYINGQLAKSGTGAPATLGTNANTTYIGSYDGTTQTWMGNIDEVRISNTTRSADEIRQAFEISQRTYPITIDFSAKLGSSNLIADSNDLSFNVDSTIYGFAAKANTLFAGDKIILRENYNGIEYIAQGNVNSVNTTTGDVTVSSWDSGSTFPSIGFSANSDAFKWQREYWNIEHSSLNTHLDAAKNLTLRVTDGYEARSIWLDDLRSSGGYLTSPSGSTITSSTGNIYLQYRAIFTSSDVQKTSSLSSTNISATIVIPYSPSGLLGVAQSSSSIQWNFTDNSNNEDGFTLHQNTGELIKTSAQPNVTTITETGLLPNTSYTRRVKAYNSYGSSTISSSATIYTMAATPSAVNISRTLNTAQFTLGANTNPQETTYAVYKAPGNTCDGTGGSYLTTGGSDNGNTAVWATLSSWGTNGTVSVSGLDEETKYVFCVKAKNSNNIETAFSPTGPTTGEIVPISGDLTVSNDNSNFISRYRDGRDSSRYIIGLDSVGANNANSSQLTLNGGSVTVNGNETLVAGKLVLGGGSLFLATQGAVIAPGAKLWAIDRDADGYPDRLGGEIKLWYGSDTPTSTISSNWFRRKALLTTLKTADCNDNAYNASNICCQDYTYYTDADADGYGSTSASVVCQESPSVPPGYSANNTDCNDASNTKWQYLTGYTDADVDGYGVGSSSQVCSGLTLASGYAANNTDCNDLKYSPNNIACLIATGGTITTISGYKVHTFTSSGTFTVSSGLGGIDYLVVGGGGGGGGANVIGAGGNFGAGGGGGAAVPVTNLSTGVGSYGVTIGTGGGGGGNGGYFGAAGSASAFRSTTAPGGGAGGGFGGSSPGTGGSPNGGNGGAAGSAGGVGFLSSINGSSLRYGAGAANPAHGAGTTGICSNGAATDGTGGTARGGGGGGGGACNASQAGGAGGARGVVVIRYPWE